MLELELGPRRAVALRPAFKPLPWQVDGVRSWLHERDERRILDP